MTAMVNAAVDIARARRAEYAHLRYKLDTYTTPVGGVAESGMPPHILIVVDDPWTGRNLRDTVAGIRLQDALVELMHLTAVGAVSIVFTALRPTDTYISPRILDVCHNRIGVRVTDHVDQLCGFGSDELTAHPQPGSAWLRRDDGRMHEFKAFYLSPRGIDHIAEQTAVLRPRLDGLSRSAAERSGYGLRWQRFADRPGGAGAREF